MLASPLSFGHHITPWHFSLEVCDLYQGAEPSVASANY